MTIEKMNEYINEAKKDADRIFRSEDNNRWNKLGVRLHDIHEFAYKHDGELSLLMDMCDYYKSETNMKEGNSFLNCNSYKEAISMYHQTKFFLYRIEHGLPNMDIEEGFDYLVEKNIPTGFLITLLQRYIFNQEMVVLKLANMYKLQKDYSAAYCLLNSFSEKYPQNVEMKIGLAEIYIIASKIEKAVEVLKTIEKPVGEIQKLIWNLEKSITDKAD